ncbi:MAG: hypothetical protein MR496_09450 [Eubacterium sp.]|nr:hypothetical protein [Eubacterium sp.]
MRYGTYSEYSSRTTKTGKGDTGFEESMKQDNNIQYKSLGIGFLNVGDTGYGMRATQIINPDSEDTIIRVSIALAGSGIELENEATGERYSVADLIEMLKQQYELTADDLEEKDWRDMSDKEWEKLLNSFDQNIDAIKDKIRKLKEVQDEAASKAAANAPAGQKANAASSAAQSAAANGFASDVKTEDEEWIEENSWTYDMKTENQTILHKAAIANEKAQDSLSKSQELMLTGDTTEGVSKTEGATESASCDDESGEKVWTVTAYTEQGIICKEFKDGVGTLLWQIDFKNPTDYNKVMDYLDNEKEEDILKYARDKEFWEKLIWG